MLYILPSMLAACVSDPGVAAPSPLTLTPVHVDAKRITTANPPSGTGNAILVDIGSNVFETDIPHTRIGCLCASGIYAEPYIVAGGVFEQEILETEARYLAGRA